jgi:hypothetical protein
MKDPNAFKASRGKCSDDESQDGCGYIRPIESILLNQFNTLAICAKKGD